MAAPSAAGVLACFWILLSFAALLIAARLWLRLKIQRQRLVISDGLLIIAWCASLGHAIFVIIFAREGALHPEIDYTLLNWTVDITKIEFVTKMIWLSVLPFFTSLYFCKFALLATYMQLFPTFMKPLRIALYATIAFCICGYIVSMSSHIFMCWPVEGNWSFASNPAAVCPPIFIANVFYIAWSLHFSANIAILTLPFFVLKGLQVKRTTMIGIYATFGLGFIDLAFSLTRFLIIQVGAGSFKPLTLIQTWSILDENIALIIACLPSLRPYLRIGFKSSSADPSYGYGYGYGGQSSNLAGTRKSKAAGAFERMDNVYPTGLTSVNRQQNDQEDDSWSEGKKSNRSDIELVTVQAQPEDCRSPTARPGEIRVDQEIRVTRDGVGHAR